MREILFRGKRVDNGMWVFGFYIENELFDGGLEPSIIPVDEKGAALYDDDGYNIEIKVNPETVGQYTGLADKNGKKIFEGDIVRYVKVDIDGSEDAYIGAICFEPEKVGFAIKRDDYRAFFVNSWLIDIEVIGNIYDNPELMGGEAHG